MDSDNSDKHHKRLIPVMLSICAVILSACAATLVPPPAVEEPAGVYVLNHGRHTSLVLVPDEHTVQRQALGEWRWYVDGQSGLLRSLGALFLPTPAALGRMRLSGPPEPDCWVDQVGSDIHAVLAFDAEQSEVVALIEDINRLFEAPGAEPYYSSTLNLEFIIDDRPYTLGDNSNHRVTEWLERLGFEIRGNPVFGRMRPDDPQRVLSADSRACSASSQSDSS
jgi:hypothetical protein